MKCLSVLLLALLITTVSGFGKDGSGPLTFHYLPREWLVEFNSDDEIPFYTITNTNTKERKAILNIDIPQNMPDNCEDTRKSIDEFGKTMIADLERINKQFPVKFPEGLLETKSEIKSETNGINGLEFSGHSVLIIFKFEVGQINVTGCQAFFEICDNENNFCSGDIECSSKELYAEAIKIIEGIKMKRELKKTGVRP